MNKQMTYRLIYYIRCKRLPSSSLFMWKCVPFFMCIFLASTQNSSQVISLHVVSPFQVRTVRWALDRAAVCRVCVRMEVDVWTCWLGGLCASVLKESLRSPTVRWAHAVFLGMHSSPSGAWGRDFTSHCPSCEYLIWVPHWVASCPSVLSCHFMWQIIWQAGPVHWWLLLM